MKLAIYISANTLASLLRRKADVFLHYSKQTADVIFNELLLLAKLLAMVISIVSAKADCQQVRYGRNCEGQY